MSPKRRVGDAGAAARRRAEQAREAAAEARRAAEEQARDAAEVAERKADEAARAGAERTLVEAAHAKAREQKRLVDVMATAAADLQSRHAAVLDAVVRPLWAGSLTGADAAAAIVDLHQAPTMRAVSEEAGPMGFLTVSIGFAGAAAVTGGGAAVLGTASGVGAGLSPPRVDAAKAYFGSLGGVYGAKVAADISVQIGVWLRAPQDLGAELPEAVLTRVFRDGAGVALADLAAEFDPRRLDPRDPPAGMYVGVEAGLAAVIAFGTGIYFDWFDPARPLDPLFQGTAVEGGVGAGVTVGALAAGRVLTHQIERGGRP